MTQFARPNSTIDNGGWAVIGAPTHHEAIDEIIANDDTDYIKCVLGNSMIKIGLSEVEEPRVRSSPDHIFRISVVSIGSGKGESFDAWLYQGTTEICQLFSKKPCPRGSYWTLNKPLGGEEAGLITDYSALDVRVAYNSLGSGEEIRVTMMELEVPDPSSATYKAPIISMV